MYKRQHTHRYVAGVKNASNREKSIAKSAEEVKREVKIGRIEDDFLLNVLEYQGGKYDNMCIQYQDGMWRHNEEKDEDEMEDWGNNDKKPQSSDTKRPGMDWDFILSSDSDDGSSRDLFRRLTHSQGIVGTCHCSLSRHHTHTHSTETHTHTHRYEKQKSEKKKKQEEQG